MTIEHYARYDAGMTKLAHIADRVLNRPLMILPDKLSLIASVLDGRIGIDAKGFEEIEADYLKSAPDMSRFVGQFERSEQSRRRKEALPDDAGRRCGYRRRRIACEPRRLDRRLFRHDVL